MEILKAPHEKLSTVCSLAHLGGETNLLAKLMIDTMYNHRGMGLAAPQVGHTIRMFVMKYGSSQLVMLNPTIIRRGNEMAKAEEGCLSIPGKKIRVNRNKLITVRWMDLNGETQEAKMRNNDARCVQHEMDHLDGILITEK